MEIKYSSLEQVIPQGKAFLVPLKNFFLADGSVLEPDFLKAGGYLQAEKNKFFLQDKLLVGSNFYLLFTEFVEKESFFWRKEAYSLAVITLSDKGYSGKREDESGPLVLSLLQNKMDFSWTRRYVLPDSRESLSYLLAHLIYFLKVDVIVTSGGTGVYPRDITPEICLKFVDKRLSGFEQAMLISSLQKTPHAMISRAVCGLAGESLLINLPGSIKAVKENLEAILPALPHTLKKFHGDPEECGKRP
ncbi:MAG: hypothetical protein PWR24_952 [Desulfonauticus sp.]|nr:hypothetical protein [Desulfonauticus sp.]